MMHSDALFQDIMTASLLGGIWYMRPGIEVVGTECAHILSKSTNVGIGEGSSLIPLHITTIWPNFSD